MPTCPKHGPYDGWCLQCRSNEERERDQLKQHQQEQQRLLKESNRIAEEAASDARRAEFQSKQIPGRMIRGLGGGHAISMEELLEAQRVREEHAEAMFFQRLAHAKTDEQLIAECVKFYKKCASKNAEGRGWINVVAMDPEKKQDQTAIVFYFDLESESTMGINVITESTSADVNLIKINKLLGNEGLTHRFERDDFGFDISKISLTETQNIDTYLRIAFTFFRNLEGDAFTLWDPTDAEFDFSDRYELNQSLKKACLDSSGIITYLENKLQDLISDNSISSHVCLFNFLGSEHLAGIPDKYSIKLCVDRGSFFGEPGIPRLSVHVISKTGWFGQSSGEKTFRMELSVFGKREHASHLKTIFFNADRKKQLLSQVGKLNDDLRGFSNLLPSQRFVLNAHSISAEAKDFSEVIAFAKILVENANVLNEYSGTSDLWYPTTGEGSAASYSRFRFTTETFEKWKKIKLFAYVTGAILLIVNAALFLTLGGIGYAYWKYKGSKKYLGL
jgi:hypothetical protein